MMNTVLARLASLRDRGLLHVMSANIAQQGIAFCGVLGVAKLLSPEDFGMVRIAMAYLAIATIIGGGGLTAPVLRYCADPRFDNEEKQRILGAGMRYMAMVAAATTLVALVLVEISGRSRTQSIILWSYSLQIPAAAAWSLLLVYFQAAQRFRYLAYSQVIIRSAGLVLTVVAAWLYGLYGFLAATLLAAVVGVVPLLLSAGPKNKREELPRDFRTLAVYSLLGMLVSTAGQYADMLILDWTATDHALVAVYSLATLFFFALSALAGAVQSVATPMFTNLIQDPEAFRVHLRRWTLGLLAAALPAALAVVAFSYGLENWFLGPRYAGLSGMVAILMLRFCLWCSYAIGGAALLGLGAIRQGTWIAITTTTLALAIGYPLCMGWNVWGAAWTQVIVALASTAMAWRIIWFEMGRLRKTAPD